MSVSPHTGDNIEVLALGARIMARIQTSLVPGSAEISWVGAATAPLARSCGALSGDPLPSGKLPCGTLSCEALATTVVGMSVTTIELRGIRACRMPCGIGALVAT